MWYDALSTWRACAKARYGYSGAAAASRLNVGGNGAHEFVHRGITICAGQLSRNASPAEPGRAKGLSLSVPGEARWYSIPKDAARNGKNPRLQGAGQMMQEAEYSVPLERLAGIMRFQGLRKPQALPGVLTSVSIKTLPRLCRGA